MAEPVSPEVRLQRMNWVDLDDVHRIEHECFTSPWPKHVFRSILVDNGAFAHVARVGQQIVGYVVAWLDRDQVIIANLAVRTSWRRQGLGRYMMEFAMEKGYQAGASWAVLDVRESNLNAIHLYSDMGFTARGRRPGYYSNPKEDSLVMQRPLP
jgi:ribosomal-protein-alanine N-acetyltransferase